MPVSMEFSMARRKLVSSSRARCTCSRRRLWRRLASSIQTVKALSEPTTQKNARPLLSSLVRKPTARNTRLLPTGATGTSYDCGGAAQGSQGLGVSSI